MASLDLRILKRLEDRLALVERRLEELEEHVDIRYAALEEQIDLLQRVLHVEQEDVLARILEGRDV